MSYDYAKLAAAALRLLDRFGQEVVVTRDAGGAYDPEEGRVVISQTAWTAKAVRGEPYTAKEIDGTLVLAGDLRLYVSAEAGRTLDPGDRITVEGEVWRVEKPNPVRPAGTTILYMAQVRK